MSKIFGWFRFKRRPESSVANFELNDKEKGTGDVVRFSFMRAASIFVAVIVFISMVGWGIVEAITKSSSGYVAIVGGRQIKDVDFIDSLEAQKKALPVQILSSEVRETIERQVLRTVIFNFMIDQEMEDLGFVVTDEVMIDLIKSDFANGSVKEFSEEQFLLLLEAGGKRLKAFLQQRKRILFFRQVAQAFVTSESGSMLAAEEILLSRHEKREFEWLRINKDIAKKSIGVPTKDELLAIYQNSEDKFLMEGYTTVKILSSDDIVFDSDVSEAEIRRYFEDSFRRKIDRSKRDVVLLFLKTKEDAEKAMFLLKKNNKDFSKVAGMIPFAEKKKLVKVGKFDVNEAMMEPLFSTSIGGLTEIIQSGDRYIIAMPERAFDDGSNGAIDPVSKSKIVSILKAKSRCDGILKAEERVKELSLSSMDLGVISEHVKGTIRSFDVKDSDLVVADQKSGVKYIDEEELLEIRKTGQEKTVYVYPINGRCGFVAVEIVLNKGGGKKHFNEVIDELKDIWVAREVNKKLEDLSNNFLARYKMIKNANHLPIFRKILSTSSVSSLGIKSVRRLDADRSVAGDKIKLAVSNGQLPSFDALESLFLINPGEISGPFKSEDGSYDIIILRNVFPPTKQLIETEKKAFFEDLANQRGLDYLDEYEEYLYDKYSVSVGSSYQHLMPKKGR